jgi:STE24 endopeptidase
LKAGLIKLHVKNLSAPHNSKLYSMYHHSHPTLPERLKAMEEYKVTKPLEYKSDKKDL